MTDTQLLQQGMMQVIISLCQVTGGSYSAVPVMVPHKFITDSAGRHPANR